MKPAIPQWIEIIKHMGKCKWSRNNQILKHVYYRESMKIVTQFSPCQLHMTKCCSTLAIIIHCVGAQNHL